jgi:hypothetical protein
MAARYPQRAPIEMPAERGGATALNGPQHFDVLPADPFAVFKRDEIGPACLFLDPYLICKLVTDLHIDEQ